MTGSQDGGKSHRPRAMGAACVWPENAAVPRRVVSPPKARIIRFLRACAMVCALSPTLALSTSNPNPNALWVAATRGVLKLATASGEILFEIEDARHVRALAVDGHDGILWTWGGRELRAFEADGPERLRTSTPAFALGPAQLAVDGVAGNVWLARGRQLDRYDAEPRHCSRR